MTLWASRWAERTAGPAAVRAAAPASAELDPPAPSPPPPEFVAALQHHTAGRFAEAAALYRGILESDPDHAPSLHRLALIELRAGHDELAAELIGRAIALEPDNAEAHSNLGVILEKRGEFGDAFVHWERALALDPDFPEAHCNLAAGLAARGKFEDAVEHYRKALKLKPEYVAAHAGLAVALAEMGRLDEAVARYHQALALSPNSPDLQMKLALLLIETGRLEEASTRAGKLAENGRLDEAQRCLERALAVAPDHAPTHFQHAATLEMQLRRDDAIAHYRRALELNPDLAAVRFRLCTVHLPIIYAEEAEIARQRAAYRAALTEFSEAVGEGRAAGDLAGGVGSVQPFYLAYQGHNDRELQRIYGELLCRIMAARYPTPAFPPPPAEDEKVRLAIVSGYFRGHTVWKLLIRGWLTQLDRRKFAIFGYHTGPDRDSETEAAAALCERFVEGPMPGERWRQEILADAPHIVLYPEIGMDPVAAWLAAQRLAATQCLSWGHPETTGYPTLDYFLSSALMEPRDAEEHYNERLVRLPNLSIYYEPPIVKPVPGGRAQLTLRDTAIVFWSGQSLFKYLPQFDQVFPRIAKEVGDCQFVFIEFHRGPHVTAAFRARLDRAFAEFGLEASQYCVILSRLDLDHFVAAIGFCDIVLDTISWSGGNTTLEGLAQDTPIVTLAGPMMRGRHTMAILRMIGIEETIAGTVDDYVATAVRLARDVAWRQAIKERIAANKHRLYRDRASILALEEFFSAAAHGRLESLSAGSTSIR
jgi:protein O-GlcNAc transferase